MGEMPVSRVTSSSRRMSSNGTCCLLKASTATALARPRRSRNVGSPSRVAGIGSMLTKVPTIFSAPSWSRLATAVPMTNRRCWLCRARSSWYRASIAMYSVAP